MSVWVCGGSLPAALLPDILVSGNGVEACWLPTGPADGEALQELPGAGGLQHATDGARAGTAGVYERRCHSHGESALGQIPCQLRA